MDISKYKEAGEAIKNQSGRLQKLMDSEDVTAVLHERESVNKAEIGQVGKSTLKDKPLMIVPILLLLLIIITMILLHMW